MLESMWIRWVKHTLHTFPSEHKTSCSSWHGGYECKMYVLDINEFLLFSIISHPFSSPLPPSSCPLLSSTYIFYSKNTLLASGYSSTNSILELNNITKTWNFSTSLWQIVFRYLSIATDRRCKTLLQKRHWSANTNREGNRTLTQFFMSCLDRMAEGQNGWLMAQLQQWRQLLAFILKISVKHQIHN